MTRKQFHSRPPQVRPIFVPPAVQAILGEEADLLLEALQGPAPVSIRSNPAKPAPVHGKPVPWCSSGHYLNERPVFTLDPLFHAGTYYVQEASSMLLEQAVRSCRPLPEDPVVLDLCAAPGGKSTHLASLLPETALLICNEPVRSRQAALMENLWKWGRPNTVITGSLPSAFEPLGRFCDLIIVDAPCSGEGMFRKDPFARDQWSEGLVERCAALQRDILGQAWDLLGPGGHLIYSTCTWETRENEDQVRWLMGQGAEMVSIPVDHHWGVVSTDWGLRCYPHRLKGEGFFIAALCKPGQHQTRKVSNDLGATLDAPLMDRLKDPGPYCKVEQDGALHVVSAKWAEQVRAMGKCLRMLAPGIPIARLKGDRWAPHPALALNSLLREEAFPVLDLDHEAALRYLRGEALPSKAASGMTLVRYDEHPLGWVNGTGGRWNNAWPAPWRIRMR